MRDEKRMGIPRKQENPEKRKDGDIGETLERQNLFLMSGLLYFGSKGGR